MAEAGAGGRPAPVHPTTISAHQPIPPEIEVGAEMALSVRVACAHGCDLRGLPVEIIASEAVTAAGALAHQDGAASVSDNIEVRAPRQVGDQAWTARFQRHECEDVVHEESALALRFRTIPHASSLTVWGAPSPTPAGGRFSVKVGLRCARGCRLSGAAVAVCDETGAAVARGRLGTAPWQGTDALYWTAIDVPAPAAEGVRVWSAELADVGAELPHDGPPAAFSVRTGKACEHRATVRVTEAAGGQPVAGVEVRVGPYRALTAADGVAVVAVPQGAFDVSIRKDGLEAPSFKVSVDGDLSLDIEAKVVPKRAELHEQAIRDFPWG